MEEKLMTSLKEMLEAGELSQEAYDKIVALLTPEAPEEEPKEEKSEKEIAEELFGMKL